MKSLLSPAVGERLTRIQDHPELYTPNERVAEALGQKSLVMLIGPCAVGKSYLIDQLVTQNPEFRKSRSFTTRPPRPDDTPDTIRYLQWTDESIGTFCDDIEAGEFVNFTFHPKTGEIYGTALQDHPGTYNLMPTLASSVEPLEALPFQQAPIIGLVTTPTQWQQWFNNREFTSSTDRAARIGEGISSLTWLLNQPRASIVANTLDADAATTIQEVVATGVTDRDEETTEQLRGYLESQLR